MKSNRLLLLLTAVVLILVVLVGFRTLKSRFGNFGAEVSEADVEQQASGRITTQKDDDIATLVVQEGKVVITIPNKQQQNVTSDSGEISIPSGTVVKSRTETTAFVFFPDNSVIGIDENSEVTVSYESSSVSIFQQIGNTWHKVQKIVSGGTYEVESPGMLATVRGTEFIVEVSEEGGKVAVKEHAVEVATIKGAGRNRKVVRKVVITQGSLATVDKRHLTKIVKSKISDKNVNKKWLQKIDSIRNLSPAELKDRLRQQKDKDKNGKVLGATLQGRDPQFEDEMAIVIQKYTQLSDPIALCNAYKDKSPDDIFNIFNSVEDKYGAERKASQEFRDVIYYIKKACSDGQLSEEEKQRAGELLKKTI